MHCQHCGFTNGQEDHRCLRCGRRLSGIVIAAPPGYAGANALALAPFADGDTRDFPPKRNVAPEPAARQTGSWQLQETQTGSWAPGTFDGSGQPGRQETLFPAGPAFHQGQPQAAAEKPAAGNVIPFEQIRRPKRAEPRLTPQMPHVGPPAPTATQRPAAQQRASLATGSWQAEQGVLDFVPASPLRARLLKTEVEAQVFCEQPVATPTHRAVAAAIDAAFILLGFGLLLFVYYLMGGEFGSGKVFWVALLPALGLVAVAYGLLWTISGRETAGMAFTDLQLITFDGFPVDARSRIVRYVFCWMSFLAGGLGVLWAVADEENLTWHDHISKTFPTVREAGGAFVKQRR